MDIKKIILSAFSLVVFYSCYNPNLCEDPSGVINVGYSSKEGVLILNTGIESESSITYISPQGDVETSVFAKKNNKPLCFGATDMYFYNNDLYIISKGDFKNPAELIVVSASDMVEKERYQLKNINFKLPDGVNKDQQRSYIFSPEKIHVLDRSNILIQDHQAVFRLNLNKSPVSLNIIEGTYRISNHGSGIDTSISTNGGVVINDKLYLIVGGWTDATPTHHIGVYEFVKNKDEVNNKIGLISQGTVSGIFEDEKNKNGMLCVATRGKKSYIAYLDEKNLEGDIRQLKVKDIISSNLLDSSPSFMFKDNLYYVRFDRSKPLEIKKYDLNNKKISTVMSFEDDDKRIARLSTGISFDNKSKKRFFISGTDEFLEYKDEKGSTYFKPKFNILLEYELKDDGSVELKNKIENKTSYPVKFIYY